MPNIQIDIKDNYPWIIGESCIVANNSDYTLSFTFDEGWEKGSKEVYIVKSNGYAYAPITMLDDTVKVPVQEVEHKSRILFVGVAQGNKKTSRPCSIIVLPSIKSKIDEEAMDKDGSFLEWAKQKIDELYELKLDPISKTDDMTQEVGKDENGKLFTKQSANADWFQNDENTPDYVKNRPGGYDIDRRTILLEETEIKFEWHDYLSDGIIPFIEIKEGQNIKVIWGIDEYNVLSYKFNEEGGNIVLGNTSLIGMDSVIPSTDVPFLIVFSLSLNEGKIGTSENISSKKISLYIGDTENVKFDKKYMPYTNDTNGEIFNDYINNKAIGEYSHAEGIRTLAYGKQSHAEGFGPEQVKANINVVSVDPDTLSVSVNKSDIVQNRNAEVIGFNISGKVFDKHTVFSVDSIIYNVISLSNEPYDEQSTEVILNISTEEDVSFGTGLLEIVIIEQGAIGNSSHAEGGHTVACGQASHSEGFGSKVLYKTRKGDPIGAHAEGTNTISLGKGSHSEGGGTIAEGKYSHAEGDSTIASGKVSHAEGYETVASGENSHAEGDSTIASEYGSHTEGGRTIASGAHSHAEGRETTASGYYSHVEGYMSTASGGASHAEGTGTTASGHFSHAEGDSTIASSEYQHVQGKYNIDDPDDKYAHIVGNGSWDKKSNAHTLDWQGNAWFQGNIKIGGTGYDDPNAKEVGGKSAIPDWNQNDETAPDYIKNRICYEEMGWDVVCDQKNLETVFFRAYSSLDEPRFKIGDKYSITVDGKKEQGTAITSDGYTEIITDSFYILQQEPYKFSIQDNIDPWNYTTINLLIEHYTKFAHKIDSKYYERIGNTSSGVKSEIFNNYTDNIASGDFSHAEGFTTTASGNSSHAEGEGSVASGYASHTEGFRGNSTGRHSHAEGSETTALGDDSHAEGYQTFAGEEKTLHEVFKPFSIASHAEGYRTKAMTFSSHAEGFKTIASSDVQHVQGVLNIEDHNNKYLHIVGNGKYIRDIGLPEREEPSNAHTIDWKGVSWYKTDVRIGGADQDDTSAISLKKLSEKVDALPQSSSDLSLGISNAKVGQTIEVLSVDETGKPTSWQVVDKVDSAKNAVDITATVPNGLVADGNVQSILDSLNNKSGTENWETIWDFTVEQETKNVEHSFLDAPVKKIRIFIKTLDNEVDTNYSGITLWTGDAGWNHNIKFYPTALPRKVASNTEIDIEIIKLPDGNYAKVNGICLPTPKDGAISFTTQPYSSFWKPVDSYGANCNDKITGFSMGTYQKFIPGTRFVLQGVKA